MNIAEGIIKFLPESLKNNPQFVGFIDKHAAKAVFGVGATAVTIGSVALVRGASKDSHIFKDMSDSMTTCKAELINAGNTESARAKYFAKRKVVLKTTAKRAIKTYGPGATMIVVGEVLQGVAFGSVSGQLATTAAALTAANTFITTVSKRTESKFGKAIRDEIFYGGETVEGVVAEIDEEGNPVIKKTETLVVSSDAPVRWTFDFRDSDFSRPNDEYYNGDILEYWEDRLTKTLTTRLRRSSSGVAYLTINEILDTMGFKKVDDIPEITRLTHGVIISNIEGLGEEVFSYRPVELKSETTDGQKFNEKTFLVEIRNVVFLPDRLKGK